VNRAEYKKPYIFDLTGLFLFDDNNLTIFMAQKYESQAILTKVF